MAKKRTIGNWTTKGCPHCGKPLLSAALNGLYLWLQDHVSGAETSDIVRVFGGTIATRSNQLQQLYLRDLVVRTQTGKRNSYHWKAKNVRETIIKDPGKAWREVDLFLRVHGHLPDQNCGAPWVFAKCKYTMNGEPINAQNEPVEDLRKDPKYIARENEVREEQKKWLGQNHENHDTKPITYTERSEVMHYRNGREAKNGDRIVQLDTQGNVTAVGVLYDAKPGNDYCNGVIAPIQHQQTTACMVDCLHLDDVKELLAKAGLDKRPEGR